MMLEAPTNFPPNFKRAMLLYAETPEFARAITLAKETLQQAIGNLGDHWYVAFSGGKDSSSLLHLVLQAWPDAWVYHYDYGADIMPQEIETSLQENAMALGVHADRFVVRQTPRVHIRERPDLGLVLRIVTEETQKHGWKVGLLGFRDEESCGRKARARNGFWNSPQQGVPLWFPLHTWTWRDVYAYVIQHDIPLPWTYHAYAQLEGYPNVRMASFFDSEFDFLGRSNLDGHVLPGFKHRVV